MELRFVEFEGEVNVTDKPHCGDCDDFVTDKPHCGDCDDFVTDKPHCGDCEG